ncbi:hypothetical protein F4861DRAFT_527007 [Xylaria intraflava]|nr:hypothetical protein F4861DRAFT_527007 [Xylaria intraflava]
MAIDPVRPVFWIVFMYSVELAGASNLVCQASTGLVWAETGGCRYCTQLRVILTNNSPTGLNVLLAQHKEGSGLLR